MIQGFLLPWMLLLASFSQALDLPKVPTRKMTRLENFQSKLIEPRHVDVSLPYQYNPKKKYAVLYMHDRQMLFDCTTACNRRLNVPLTLFSKDKVAT